MTPDERRAKCIEAMARAAHRRFYNNYDTVNGPESWETEAPVIKARWIAAQEGAFDSLHGIGTNAPSIDHANEGQAPQWRDPRITPDKK
jgi:hypothetical protein